MWLAFGKVEAASLCPAVTQAVAGSSCTGEGDPERAGAPRRCGGVTHEAVSAALRPYVLIHSTNTEGPSVR